MMMLGAEHRQRDAEVEDSYREASRELPLEEWSSARRACRYIDNVMRLTAALQ